MWRVCLPVMAAGGDSTACQVLAGCGAAACGRGVGEAREPLGEPVRVLSPGEGVCSLRATTPQRSVVWLVNQGL